FPSRRSRRRMAGDELAVDPVLEAPGPARLRDEAAPVQERAPVGGVEDGEEAGLGAVAPRRASLEERAQVRGENRSLADRVDAGLRERMSLDVDAVARA